MNTLTINYVNTNDCKPSTTSAKASESRNTKSPIVIDPLTFAELVVTQGRSFCPAVFNGGRSNNNWIAQSVFALDFDSGILPEDVIERSITNNLVPNVVYASYSDSEQLRKFRVVYFFDIEIKAQEKAKELILSLLHLFPEADQCTKDASRLMFGGKEVLFFEDTIIPLVNAVGIVHRYRSSLEKVGDEVGSILAKQSTDNNFSHAIRKINKSNFNFERAIERLQILADFMDGRKLAHPQLFGLATNLKYINNGLDLMLEVMSKYGVYANDKFELIEQVKRSDYKSQRIGSFSEYAEDGKWKNVFAACLK